GVELLLGQEIVESVAKSLRLNTPSQARPQIFARYSRKKRVFFVKIGDTGSNFQLNFIETSFGEQYQRLGGDSSDTIGCGEMLCGRSDLIFFPAGARQDFLERQSEDGAFGHGGEYFAFVPPRQCFEEGHATRVANGRTAGERVQDYAAANGGDR